MNDPPFDRFRCVLLVTLLVSPGAQAFSLAPFYWQTHWFSRWHRSGLLREPSRVSPGKPPTDEDEIVWAVQPGKDDLRHLAQYLGRYADEFLALNNVHR
jgi:hypothetical protein